MELSRRSTLIHALLLGIWVLVVAWQVEEHLRVKEAAKTDLRNRSREIANTLSATIRALRYRGAIVQDRLEPVLNELISGHTNELVGPSELIAIVLLNTMNEPVIAAGKPIDPQEITQGKEQWDHDMVMFVNPVEGANLQPEGSTNATVVLPSPRDFTNTMREPPHEPPPRRDNGDNNDSNNPPRDRGERDRDNRPPERRGPRRPPWMRWMDQAAYEALIGKRELHGLALGMSTENYRAVCSHDLLLRCTIAFFAGISAIGAAFAWRNLATTSELQIRLVRASELTSHLKEMNLAAAGLAHETRNPLNIIRGQAQMLSRMPEAPEEIKEKSRAIVDEVDKVTVQLNEFINYSRPREIRHAVLPLNSAINEIIRALSYDIEEKKVRVELKGEPLHIEADEQLLRQALFNLVLNAIQAAYQGGEIELVTSRASASEGVLEIRDNGPGVPLERRKEIFKPYFTTHQRGTGLGLAVVQQIVLAHGWEVECLGNEPKGAIFRITHLKLVAKGS